MDHLMTELVGRSIARERERELSLRVSLRQAETRRVATPSPVGRPSRQGRRVGPTAAPA